MVEANTFNELQHKIQRGLDSKFGSSKTWINEVFLNKNEFVFDKEERLFHAKYTFGPKGDIVVGETVEVRRSVTFPKV